MSGGIILNLKIEVVKNILVIYLYGELDHHNAEKIRDKIDDEIDSEGLSKLILDFSNVTFMDSSGIGVVVGRYKKLTSKKGNICITRLNNTIKRVFELSGLFKLIKNYDNIEQALQNV